MIIRRKKHEAMDFTGMSRRTVVACTDKRHGSKFLPAWKLDRMVAWVASQVERANWTRRPGRGERINVRVDEPAGLVDGQIVHTIRIESDGCHVHAYPVKDTAP